jgi:hypothetical protein
MVAIPSITVNGTPVAPNGTAAVSKLTEIEIWPSHVCVVSAPQGGLSQYATNYPDKHLHTRVDYATNQRTVGVLTPLVPGSYVLCVTDNINPESSPRGTITLQVT